MQGMHTGVCRVCRVENGGGERREGQKWTGC